MKFCIVLLCLLNCIRYTVEVKNFRLKCILICLLMKRYIFLRNGISFWEKLEIVGNLLPRQFIKITL